MMRFGFFGKFQENIVVDAPGFGLGTGQPRYLGWTPIAFGPNSAFIMEYDLSNTGANPDLQVLLSDTQVAFSQTSQRAVMGTTVLFVLSSGPVAGLAAAGPFRGYRWNSNAALTPANRLLKYIIPRPELIKRFSLSAINGGSAGAPGGSNFTGSLRLPYMPNCESIMLCNTTSNASTGSAPSVQITEITGKLPPKMKQFIYSHFSGVALTALPALPATIENVMLASSNATFTALVPSLIAGCPNLIGMCFTHESWTESAMDAAPATTRTALSGNFDISHIGSWKYLSIISAALTNITYSMVDANIRRLALLFCTGLNNTTMLNLLTMLLDSANGEFVNIKNSNRTFTKALVDADFKNTLTDFYTYGNIITGDITLTTSRPNLVNFKYGNGGINVSEASKNVATNVNISGLTHAAVIDLSNSKIENITLPANTICNNLALGGNKLSVAANPSLMSQITAMTGLNTLRLSQGSVTDSGTQVGQDSVDGFGNNFNVSALSSLVTLVANSCKLTGVLTTHANISSIFAVDNNITSISGAGGALLNLRINSNPNFNQDFTQIHNITVLAIAGNGVQTNINLSGKTTTGEYALISISTCSVLTTVSLPSTAANCRIGSAGTVFNIEDCDVLTAINNLDQLSYNLTGAQNRAFQVRDCATLNIDFKIGVNWVANTINVSNNALSNAMVDTNIDSLYTNRAKWNTLTQPKTLNIGGAGNGVAGGTYQAPAGFVLGSNDGTPASAKEQAYVLVNNYGWTITMN